LGWTDGSNLRIDVRWAAANFDRARIHAEELVDLQPDVILANSTPVTAALQRETLTIPIVFVGISDPVGSGFATSLPRPGGSLTGFVSIEASLGGKWLELLMEIAPAVKRAAIILSPVTLPAYYLPSFEAAARSLNVMPITAPIRTDAEIETIIASLGRQPGGGLIFPPDVFTTLHRGPIILLAARNNLSSRPWQERAVYCPTVPIW
jgi:putative ABC transport system substrate-binding protein